ncbi:MAG: GPI inositol-deacylase [Vicinamibacteria bacterium]|nr:GPI inositol-deacylase [Vicinamibacteria bacterium]
MTPRGRHGDVATLRGVSRLATEATTGIADLAEALHSRIARGPSAIGGPLISGAVNGIAGLVYKSVRGVTRVVGGGLEAGLARLEPLLLADGFRPRAEPVAGPMGAAPRTERLRPQTPARPAVRGASAGPREALLATLNGVLGDYLAETGNPLAIPMALRQRGVPLELTRAGLRSTIDVRRGTAVVFVHGLCMNDRQWRRARTRGAAHDHGAALARDLGVTPLYLHYNSGRHVSLNGRAFAVVLEELVAAWPGGAPRLVIVGHSMGGLVARSAVYYGAEAGLAWPRQLRALVFLGTPHHGAPLERGGHGLHTLLESTGYTEPFARLGRVRSAGITDLRHGSALDEDWQGRDRFAHGHDTRRPLPLPDKVTCFTMAATRSRSSDDDPAIEVAPGPRVAKLAGDGLVPVTSALGRHVDPRLELAFAPSRQAVARDCGHLDLLSSRAVYNQLRAWLAARR